MSELLQVEVGLLGNFCTFVADDGGVGDATPERRGGEAAIVDPAFEGDRLLRIAAERSWRITTILVTHSHDDHVAAVDELAAATDAVIRCHPLEIGRVRALVGGSGERVVPVADGEVLKVGDVSVEAIYAPGHSPGCVCWSIPASPAVITGDVLYVGSCGSVSDPAAFFATLQRLSMLPEMTRVYPGHDFGDVPTSRLAWELVKNPAFAATSVEEFCVYKGIRPPRV